MDKQMIRIEKNKLYKADNGNIGIFKGKWMTNAFGIIYILEDLENHTVGYLKKKNVANNKLLGLEPQHYELLKDKAMEELKIEEYDSKYKDLIFTTNTNEWQCIIVEDYYSMETNQLEHTVQIYYNPQLNELISLDYANINDENSTKLLKIIRFK